MTLINLEKAWRVVSPSLLDMGMRSKILRAWVLRKAEKNLFEHYITDNPDKLPQKVCEIRARVVLNLLQSIDRAFEDGRIGHGVLRAVTETFIGYFVMEDKQRQRRFFEKHGIEPPSFLVISPTKKCNLRCKGCYAASSAQNAETLSYSVLQRLIREKTEQWGSHLTVLTGGEPLLYQSEGKDLFDLLADNRDSQIPPAQPEA